MDLFDFIYDILDFINFTIIPFLLAVAFLVFIWNIARYAIIGGGSEENRARARKLAMYGIFAFVFIVVLWGLVNMLVYGLGFNRQDAVTPDYIEEEAGYDFNFRIF